MEQHDFNDSTFFAHVRRKLGELTFLHHAMAAYYAMRDPETPRWAKMLIASALVYFVTPMDAIPDFSPIIGYLDDAGVIAKAIETASAFVTEEHYGMADRWFSTRGRLA